MAQTTNSDVRHDWSREQIAALFSTSLPDLIFQAQQLHRTYHDPNRIQLSTLLSIKTGGCPEDCGYCPQSARYKTGVEASRLMNLEEVERAACAAKEAGATRFCMGAAWRSPKDRDVSVVCEMIERVKGIGLETCVTLGMLSAEHVKQLARAGLDYYNHNLDTGPEDYSRIITTRAYEDRLETIANVRAASIKVCCGGIIGMGESVDARIGLLHMLASMDEHPESVPINMLVRVEGTPLFGSDDLDPLDFVRMIAVARILMPKSVVRLSAGRRSMSQETQVLCFLAGANSIFFGDRLLTTANPEQVRDLDLLQRIGVQAVTSDALYA
jgi:biotin synthase